MAKGPDFTGFGGYGPWPDNDKPVIESDACRHYEDGYRNRAPGGHIEAASEYWLDCLVYPERTDANSRMLADMLDNDSRYIRTTVGNITGKKPGPEN